MHFGPSILLKNNISARQCNMLYSPVNLLYKTVSLCHLVSISLKHGPGPLFLSFKFLVTVSQNFFNFTLFGFAET